MVGWTVLAALLAGCTEEVDVFLTDPSEPRPETDLALESAEIPLDEVEALLDGEWVPLARGPDPYNLLDFSGDPNPVELTTLRDEPFRLALQELPLGTITKLRLKLREDETFHATAEGDQTRPVTIAEDAPPPWEVDVRAEVVRDETTKLTIALDVQAALSVTVEGFRFEPLFEPADGG